MGDEGVFEVAIGPADGSGCYKVEVLRSGAGEASEVIELDPGALAARHLELQNAVLASAVPARRVLPETEKPIRAVGQTLFTALLGTGKVAGQYRAAAAVAATHDQDLRVVLRIDTPELACLPWEAMYDDVAGAYVCLNEQLVRQVPVTRVPAPLTVSTPLRILGVISAPRGLPALDVEKERDLLTKALAGPVRDGLVEVAWAPSATWADLHDLLLSRQWHVLHYVGHGGFDPVQDEGILVLTDEDGRADVVEAHRFAGLLRQARPMPRLVVLNACSGATTGSSDLFSGTAAALSRGGVSAVTAMQYEISDKAAAAFARGFYSAIAHGRGIDDAVSSGRVAILGTGSRTLEWLTPVLYLRGDHARLFAMTQEAVTAKASPASPASPASEPEQRGASQRTARSAPSRLVRILTGHTNEAWGVAFSPDSSLVATAGHDHTVRIWRTANGTTLRTLTGHTSFVLRVAFSPDGTLIASASSDNTARIWRVADGTPVRTLTGHAGPVWGVAFSPDGAFIATAGSDGTARIWRTADGTIVRTLTGHTHEVWGAAFSPDGTMLATAGSDHTVRIWHTADGTTARTLTGHSDLVLSVAFSPDGNLIAATSYSNTAQLWHTADGTKAHTLTGHAGPVWGVAFSPDGALVATASNDQKARIWHTADGTPAGILSGHAGRVRGVAFSPDGTLLATASSDHTARLWE